MSVNTHSTILAVIFNTSTRSHRNAVTLDCWRQLWFHDCHCHADRPSSQACNYSRPNALLAAVVFFHQMRDQRTKDAMKLAKKKPAGRALWTQWDFCWDVFVVGTERNDSEDGSRGVLRCGGLRRQPWIGNDLGSCPGNSHCRVNISRLSSPRVNMSSSQNCALMTPKCICWIYLSCIIFVGDGSL